MWFHVAGNDRIYNDFNRRFTSCFQNGGELVDEEDGSPASVSHEVEAVIKRAAMGAVYYDFIRIISSLENDGRLV